MKIEIFGTNFHRRQVRHHVHLSKEAAEKNGLVLIFTAKKNIDAEILDAFNTYVITIRERTPKGRMLKNCSWEKLHFNHLIDTVN